MAPRREISLPYGAVMAGWRPPDNEKPHSTEVPAALRPPHTLEEVDIGPGDGLALPGSEEPVIRFIL